MFKTSKQRDTMEEEGRFQTEKKTKTKQKTTWTGVSMLVTLVKARGASNKGKHMLIIINNKIL